MLQSMRFIWKKIDNIVHPPLPPKIQEFHSPEFHPRTIHPDPTWKRPRSQTTPYRKWRKIRNRMARESRRINRGD